MNRAHTMQMAAALLAALCCSTAPAADAPRDKVRAERVFSVHDSDADGFLSRGEYESLLRQRRQRQAASGRPVGDFPAPPAFDQMDVDGDQHISADELTRVLGQRLRLRQRHGPPGEHRQP